MGQFLILTDTEDHLVAFNRDHIVAVLAPGGKLTGALLVMTGPDQRPAHVKETVEDIIRRLQPQ